jgi:hypothetical protein
MVAKKGAKRGGPRRAASPARPEQHGASSRSRAVPEISASPSRQLHKSGAMTSPASAAAAGSGGSPAFARPVALVVVGMHRSGTSALGYCLSRVGAGLPVHLVGAGAANERGHWEPEKIIALNDKYLEALGSGWDDWRKLDIDAFPKSMKAAFVREIKSTVRAEYPGQTLLMIKDPRIARMLPLYDVALREAGYEPRYILCMRNPAEVAGSLSDRDGMSEPYANLLWLRYMLDAELATRSIPRSLHRYDLLMCDWRGALDAIGLDLELRWPKALDDAETEISAFLDKGLRHFWSEGDSFGGQYADWLRRAWAGLQNAGSARGRRELDAVRAEFDEFCAGIGDQVIPEVYARQRQTQREATLHRENAERLAALLREEVDGKHRAEAFLAEANARIADMEGKVVTLAGEGALQRDNAMGLEERLRMSVDRIQQLEADSIQREMEFREREAAEAVRLEASMSERLQVAVERIQQLETEAESLGGKFRDSEQRVRQEREDREREAAMATRLHADYVELGDRHSRMMEDHVGLAERYDRLTSDHSGLSERLVQVEADYAGMARRLNEANALIIQLKQQVSAGASQHAIERSEFATQLAGQRHSEALLQREIAFREAALQEAAARIAVLERELRTAVDRRIEAAEKYEQRLGEIVLRFGDQASEALQASVKYSAEKAAISERLLLAEKGGERAAAMIEELKRAGSEREDVAAALRMRLSQTEAELVEACRKREESALELTARSSRLAKLQVTLSEVASAFGISNVRSEAEPEALIAELSNLQSATATAAADRAAERDAAYDRLREARSEREALIQQMGQILLDVSGKRAVSVDPGDLEALRQEVRGLRSSTSWKVTAPLRSVGRLLGRGQR